MRVDTTEARDIYEHETIEGGRDKRSLERQNQSFCYGQILKCTKPEKTLAEGATCRFPPTRPSQHSRTHMSRSFSECRISQISTSRIRSERSSPTCKRFLPPLGCSIAFVAQQKQIRIGEQERYIELVFYHCRLKFSLLIALKIGELPHANVGQMNGYIRMFDDLFVTPDANLTIGLILRTSKNETLPCHSVLSDRKQIFASRYMLFLPAEEQLRMEIEKALRTIESNLEDQSDA